MTVDFRHRGKVTARGAVAVLLLAACGGSGNDEGTGDGPFAGSIPQTLPEVTVTCRMTRSLTGNVTTPDSVSPPGAVYLDSGLQQRTYRVVNGVFEAGVDTLRTETDHARPPACQVSAPDGMDNTRVVLPDGSILYRSRSPGNVYTDRFEYELIVDRNGQFKSCKGTRNLFDWVLVRPPPIPIPGPPSAPYTVVSACGEGTHDLDGVRAPFASLSTYASSEVLPVPPANLTQLSASADGRFVSYYFNANAAPQAGETSGARVLDRGPGTITHLDGVEHAAISADGTFLVAPADCDTSQYQCTLQFRELPGGAVKNSVRVPLGVPSTDPYFYWRVSNLTLSSGASVVAIQVEERDFKSFTVFDRDTGGIRRIDFRDRIHMHPRVSPNGRYVSFASLREDLDPGGGQAGGYRLDTLTGEVVKLVDLGPSPWRNAGLLISDDGRLGFFGANDAFFLRDFVTGEQHAIVFDAVRAPEFQTAAFSADGHLLAFGTSSGVGKRDGIPEPLPALTVFHDTRSGAWQSYPKDWYTFGAEQGPLAMTSDGRTVVEFKGQAGAVDVVAQSR